MGEISVKTGNNARNGGKNSLNRLIRCVCGKKIGPDPRNFNQRVSLGRNDLLIRTFPKELHQEIKNYSKKEMDIFIRTVTLLAYSRITPEAASNEFKKNNLIPLLLLLPTDPHQRLSILHLLKKV
ncbi:hypothetical protein L7U79_005380 [Klebsiella pneumoniae]